MGKAAKNTVRIFVAGMGTILSVSPSIAVERSSSTPSQRLANATNRVGGYFVSALAKDPKVNSERKKQKAA